MPAGKYVTKLSPVQVVVERAADGMPPVVVEIHLDAEVLSQRRNREELVWVAIFTNQCPGWSRW